MLGAPVSNHEREEHDLRVNLETEVDRLTKLVLAIEQSPAQAHDLIRDYRKQALS